MGDKVVRPGLVLAGGTPFSRREFWRRATMAGIGASFLGLAGGRAASAGSRTLPARAFGSTAESPRDLTPAFYDWILALFPIDDVSADFPKPIDVQQAPVQGFNSERFIAEAAAGESTWDVFIGMTPVADMAALVEADIIVPWSEYLPEGLAETWIPSVREEATYRDGLFSYPYDVSVVASAWNAELVEKAGLDPEVAPVTWDEWLANARAVIDSGAAPFGATFDANGWRSLAAITHSIDTDACTEEGLFDFTHPATVEALEIMKQLMEVANPDVLDPGATDAGANVTPDEAAFAARNVAYIFKHQYGMINTSTRWPDPTQLRLAGLPKTPDGVGGTAFWSTGAGLFNYGYNKDVAAEYMQFLTNDERIQRTDVGNEGAIVGQLPAYETLWDQWETEPPDWLASWAFLLKDQLSRAKAIRTHPFGINQFFVGRPYWEEYLRGDESDPAVALKNAQDAVNAEIEAAG